MVTIKVGFNMHRGGKKNIQRHWVLSTATCYEYSLIMKTLKKKMWTLLLVSVGMAWL